MNRYLNLMGLFFLLAYPFSSNGQDKNKKEEKTPVFSYVVDDPMDQFQPPPDSANLQAYNYRVPEFYFHTPRIYKDTTYEFFCYDVHDSLMAAVYDYDSVFYYSLYKSYTDYTHTYITNEGKKAYLPVSSIYKRYDKVGKEKWMTIEYPGNKYGELRAFKNVIVRRDTEKVKNTNGDYIYQRIYHYFKLIK